MTSLPTLAARTAADDKTAFLRLIRDGKTVSAASEELGISRWVFMHPKHGLVAFDNEFAQALAEALMLGQGVLVDEIEDEIRRRAMDGDRRDSGLFLRLLAARHIPGYRPSSRVEVTGANGGAIKVEERRVSLVAVTDILRNVGALDGPGVGDDGRVLDLPGPRNVLPARADAAPSGVPAAPAA